MTCVCGVDISAPGLEELIQPALDHFTEVHPEYGLGAVNVRNYLESEDRMAGSPLERLDSIGEVEIVSITPDRAGDVISFFDRDAFAGNPAWGSCYCMAYFLAGDAPSPTWQENREAIRGRVEQGTVTGTLAYVDGVLAGWCNATARSELPRRSTGDDLGVCSVVCFVLSPPYRCHGISRQLLTAAIEQAGEQGFRSMEAYPVREPRDAGDAFRGTLALFKEAGFGVVSEEPLTVRLEL